MAIDINIPSQVKNYANLAGFPATGSLKTIFIAEDTNKTYRWTGSAYVEISASQATAWGTITGTLSSQTDLNTALSGKVPTSRTLTINGTTQDLSADRTFTISTGITIGTTAITSGTVGRVLFEGTGNVVQESANLFWDNTNGRLGVGTSTPAYQIDVVGGIRVATGTSFFKTINGGQIIMSSLGDSQPTLLFADNNGNAQYGNIKFYDLSFRNGSATVAKIFSTGNVGINTTTDAGFKLDINGTARVKGAGATSATSALTIQNSAGTEHFRVQDDGVLFVRSSTATRTGSAGSDYYLDLGNIVVRNGNGTAASTMSIGKSTVSVASSIFELVSTTKGFLPPRMTTTEKNAIATPAAGLVVYDSTLNKLCVRTASAWETITSL
jgi:hypothetical protein